MFTPPTHKPHYGFTLIELSIVLIVIGLIIGGVLVGGDLIHAAELRSVVSEVEKINTSLNTFYLKYKAMPGDMRNADQFFTGVYNGNGNGTIGQYESAYNPATGLAVSATYEYHTIWIILDQAGIMPPFKTQLGHPNVIGRYCAGRTCPIPGSVISNAGYNIYWLDSYPVAWGAGSSIRNLLIMPATYIQLGKITNASYNTVLDGGIITVEDAKTIDTKIDDGYAKKGRVISGNNANNNTCVDSTIAYEWKTSDTTNSCAMVFRTNIQ